MGFGKCKLMKIPDIKNIRKFMCMLNKYKLTFVIVDSNDIDVLKSIAISSRRLKIKTITCSAASLPNLSQSYYLELLPRTFIMQPWAYPEYLLAFHTDVFASTDVSSEIELCNKYLYAGGCIRLMLVPIEQIISHIDENVSKLASSDEFRKSHLGVLGNERHTVIDALRNYYNQNEIIAMSRYTFNALSNIPVKNEDVYRFIYNTVYFNNSFTCWSQKARIISCLKIASRNNVKYILHPLSPTTETTVELTVSTHFELKYGKALIEVPCTATFITFQGFSYPEVDVIVIDSTTCDKRIGHFLLVSNGVDHKYDIMALRKMARILRLDEVCYYLVLPWNQRQFFKNCHVHESVIRDWESHESTNSIKRIPLRAKLMTYKC